jgi:hypothetical protein
VFLCMVLLLVILVIAALVYGVVAFVYGSSKCYNELNLMLEPSCFAGICCNISVSACY